MIIKIDDSQLYPILKNKIGVKSADELMSLIKKDIHVNNMNILSDKIKQAEITHKRFGFGLVLIYLINIILVLGLFYVIKHK